jgi:uncharacterized RDD family membrane protein YckC
LHSIDKLTVDTPEQIALELPLAGIGSRSLALAIDSLLQFILAILTILALFVLDLLIPGSGRLIRTIGIAAALLICYCLYWGYFAFFEIVWNGQTPGKRVAGIRVIKESGRPITPVEAIGRNMVRAIDMLPGFYAAGLICMMLNRRNKRLGDYVAGTVLVHDKAIETLSPIWNPGSLSTEANSRAAEITPDELLLIETYLNRRHQLDSLVRRKTAEQIIFMIKDRTNLERVAGQSDEAFLEALARKIRDTAGYRK